MKPRSFGNKIMRKFRDTSLPINLDASWEALEKRRRKKERKPLWIFFTAVLIFGGGLIIHKNHTAMSNLELPSELTSDRNIDEDVPHNTEHKIKNDDLSLKANRVDASKVDHSTHIKRQQLESSITKGKTNLNKWVTSKKFQPQALHSERDDNLSRTQNSNRAVIKSIDANSNLKDWTTLQLSTFETESVIMETPHTVSLNMFNEVETKSSKRNHFGLSMGYGFNSKWLRANNESAEERIKSRRQYESGWDKFEVNINYGRDLTPRLFIETGLNIQLWTDRLQGRIQKTYEVTKPVLVSINDYRNGTIEKVYEWRKYDVTDRYTFDAWNQQFVLSVPLRLGYNIWTKGKYTINFLAGVNYSLYLYNEGTQIQENQVNIDIAGNYSKDYRNTSLVSAVISGEVAYLYAQYTSLLAGIQLEADILSRTKGATSYTERHFAGSVYFGIRKKF